MAQVDNKKGPAIASPHFILRKKLCFNLSYMASDLDVKILAQ